MKKIISFFSAFFFASLLFSQTSAVATSSINLRQSAAISGDNILGVIPQGSELEVVSCEGEWCSVVFGEYSGYVNKKFIKSTSPDEIHTSTPTATSPVHYYTNSRGNEVQSPTQYSSQPAGASAQCADGSYSFSQSRRGTCSHHGGVARWL